MTVDVYAGDMPLPGDAGALPAGAAKFQVIADAHADVVVRVSAALNLLNVAPRMFHMEARPGGLAAVEATIECAAPQAELIARKLQQLTSVRDVALVHSARAGVETGVESARSA